MDWNVVGQIVNLIGIPAIVTWFLYDRKRIINESRVDGASAVIAEGKAPHEIRSSSVVTLEAEIIALTKSFEADRRIKESTIVYLEGELTDARAEIMSKDDLIDALKKQVRSMMSEAEDLKRRLSSMERQLSRFRPNEGDTT